jgi:UDP-N-acetylglucosamine--dolichyl-phosphate N-acetylglucosaminephosphotransferase
MILEMAVVLATGFLITLVSVKKIIPKMVAAGIVGRDVNKPERPHVAEMGGVAIVMGFVGAVLLAIAMHETLGIGAVVANEIGVKAVALRFDLVSVLAAMVTVLIVALVGVFDDLFNMAQRTKALLPIVAAIPLIAVQFTSSSAISFPFVGMVDFGIVYFVILIPLAITVCSNLTNMLAGFNGLEAGMGSVMFVAILALAIASGSVAMGVLSAAMLGALLAFLLFNWFPAKVFMGDIGTLSIGTVAATAVIIGNYKVAGVIMFAPYVVDFAIKAINRFPSANWWGEPKGGKLFAPEGRARGLCQLIMKKMNGISERNLVLLLIAVEMVFAAVALALYLPRVV